jgi:SAM-dependent methyltransferase
MTSSYRRFRGLCRRVLYFPAVKKVLMEFPFILRLYPQLSFERTHPVDVAYGIDTSGFVTVEKLSVDAQLTPLIMPYAGSQPSIIRRALAALGDIGDYTFADLGCGKGRVTIVASEFPFRRIMGIELSPDLTRIARTNAATVTHNFPHRTQIDIFETNAVDFPFPDGKLVVFLYHSFGRKLLAGLIERLESRLSSGLLHLFFVYCNPVNGDLFDASPAFERWYAESIPYDVSEMGYGPDSSDAVIVWQSGVLARETPHVGIHREIIVTKPRWKADLVPG